MTPWMDREKSVRSAGLAHAPVWGFFYLFGEWTVGLTEYLAIDVIVLAC